MLTIQPRGFNIVRMPDEPLVAFSLRLPESLAREVEAFADADSRPKANFLVLLIRDAIAAKKREKALASSRRARTGE